MPYLTGWSSPENLSDYADTTRELVVTCAGLYSGANGNSMRCDRPAGRQDYLIMWCIAGGEGIVLDGQVQQLAAGWACLYKPHEPQHTGYNQKDAHVLWVHFTGSGCKDLLEQCGIGGASLFRVGTDDSIEHIVAQTIEELNLKRQHWQSVCAALLRQALLLTGRHAAEQASQRQVAVTMSDIAAYMHANYAQSITVDSIAAMAGMNRFAFIRSFRDATGRTPIDYVIRLRIEKARELLSRGRASVKVTAATVGFGNPYYFSRMFKKHEGVPPEEYMRRHAARSSAA